MEEILRELVAVVDAFNTKTCWDYLVVVSPIIISITAIIVSIKTSRKQNKIAVFEKRFEIIYLLTFILSVCDDIIKNEELDKSKTLKTWMTSYLAVDDHLSTTNYNENNDYFTFYTRMIFKLCKVECLFKKIDAKLIMDFLEDFNDYVLKVQNNEPSDIELQNIKKKVLQIKQKKVMDRLEASVKL